jgi:hypothetical protein
VYLFDGAILRHFSKISTSSDCISPDLAPPEFVILVDLRPANRSGKDTARPAIWEHIKNPGVKKLMQVVGNPSPKHWRHQVLHLADSESCPLLGLMIVGDPGVKIEQAKEWARWGRSQGCRFIVGANLPRGEQDIAFRETLFDLTYETQDPAGLLYALNMMLENNASFIGYDFTDLGEVWGGRHGIVWQVPSDYQAFSQFLKSLLNVNRGVEPAAWTLSCYGSLTLVEIDALAAQAEKAFSTDKRLLAAWMLDEPTAPPNQHLCILYDDGSMPRS